MYFEVDGTFPNHAPNPLLEENSREIRARVVAEKADLGIAWDGDADRCFFIDEGGEFVPGDFVTALLAEALLLKNPGAKILYDLRASRAVPDVITGQRRRAPAQPRRARLLQAAHAPRGRAVRRRSVRPLLLRRQLQRRLRLHPGAAHPRAALAEEGDDGGAAGAAAHASTSSAARSTRSSTTSRPRWRASRGASPTAEQGQLDGISVDYDDWHFNVRPSNTEPLLRLNLGADSQELMEEKRDLVLSVIRRGLTWTGGSTDLGPARRRRHRPRRHVRRGRRACPGSCARATRPRARGSPARSSGRFPAVPPAEPSGVAVCGMGGSAIGADLVLACPAGASACRPPWCAATRLPEWVGRETLVDRRQLLRARRRRRSPAPRRRARAAASPCASSSGGGLAALAEARGPAARRRARRRPAPRGRRLCCRCRCWPRWRRRASAASTRATWPRRRRSSSDDNAVLGPDVAGRAEPRQVAGPSVLEKRLAVVYGAGPTAPVARRWKGQINENAKAPAFFNELPELDHNELMGWTSLPHVTAGHRRRVPARRRGEERLARRAELTAREYEALGVATELVAARGDSPLARLFSLVQLGDYASLLPRAAVRRRPHAGGRHPGVQGRAWPATRRLTPRWPREAVALVLTADDAACRAAGAALFPGVAARELSREELRPARALRGAALRAARRRERAARASALVVPAVWSRRRGAGRPRRPATSSPVRRPRRTWSGAARSPAAGRPACRATSPA